MTETRAAKGNDRRAQAGAASGRFLKRAAVIAETLDQTADQVVRPRVRNLAHHQRHVHHAVALQHAQFEIIEE